MHEQPNPDPKKPFDVAILGSGIAGSMLGAILARNGAKVLLIDAASHPKFAIGESTIPYTLVALRTISERYDVPEIKTLATFTNSTKVLGPKFGVKKHFGFLLHHEGRPQDPREVNQFDTPGLLHEASHLYRQDIDAYMYHTAVKYGCVPRVNFRVEDVDFDDSGVTLSSAAGEQYRARYVVDASGYRSPLAEKFRLREETCRFKHHSRSIWNHMIDVPPTDTLFHHSPENTPPVPWYEGTVHHMFQRGWFWVIGFDNHPWSRNPLCSVGLTLDPRSYPRSETMTPEEEFHHYAQRFPDVARQFEGAKPMREWVSTGRLQYSSTRCSGDRWFLLSHAAGFIDPLFSRGLSNTAEAINTLSWRLLEAVKDDDFSQERFDYVDRLQQGLFDYNDSLVNAAYISWDDYDLWTAVFRVWAWGANAGTFHLQSALTKYLKDGRDEHFKHAEDVPHLGLYWPNHEGYKSLYDEMVEQCDAFESGKSTAREAADTIYDHIARAPYVPKHFGFAERDQRFLHPTPKVLRKTIGWARKEGDPAVRRLMFGTGIEALKAKAKGRRIF
ncbi:NAD(P)/FAD-dependent oxidoreductase [Streptomyces sp. GSL17-111]|uniref:NAD(P)/FAD-dependent oxidoreductase n=1 Tax=Streptomyces sp. GSL17-111 TaxID=3121596 RepID=UPI0030F43A44